ncbi:antitoxin of toxin-antitoxin stability system [Brenneria populi]|uniref:Antitoxin of toxin-antitoxin stability system n=1 Tax=Brenneria populi TaxID=1505588 RepID=A0ABU6JNM3_9GAMM|nr:antitoxin of toxin-antitoxin stability system [Brenneria populi Li et al. 2015]
MTTKAVFTMKLEPELRDAFMAEAAADDRPAAQVIRELMRGYIEQRRQSRDYDTYLRRKVDIARKSMTAGRGRTNDEVEAAFAARRNEVTAGNNKS